MRIPRIYHPGRLDHPELTLSTDATTHITRVLRLRDGAPLIVFDGQGHAVNATLLPAQGKLARVQIGTSLNERTESPLAVHLGIAMIKGERMSYALQKAVELGVTSITPLSTEHSVIQLAADRQSSKHEHWFGILQNACEQCHRSVIPQLHPAMQLTDWVKQSPSDLKCYFDVNAKQTLPSIAIQPKSISIVIGPEGGLSESECHAASMQGFVGIRLGPRILRAETAVVAALSAMQLRWGDFG